MYKELLFIMLLPVPTVTLLLNTPRLLDSTWGRELFFSWTKQAGDPNTIELQFDCVPQDLIFGVGFLTFNTSKPNALINIGNTHIIGNLTDVKTPCHLLAYYNSNQTINLIASSVTFRTEDTAAGELGFVTASDRTSSNHRGPLIGGVVGGFLFLVFVFIFGFLYHRRRRVSLVSAHTRQKRTVGHFLHSSALFQRYVPNVIADPMLYDESYKPPESKQERLERARQEIEEAQRLRDVFRLDLERRSNTNIPEGDDVEGRLGGVEVVAIRAQIQQMSAMIAALQAEVGRQTEDSEPPGYSTVVGS